MIYFIPFFEMRNSITLFEDQYKFFKTFNSHNLLIAFVEFMFEDKEPECLNEQESVIFDSLRIRMENLKNKSKAWSKSHGWWRPPKTTEKQHKNGEINNKEEEKKQQKNNRKTTEKQQEQVQVQEQVQDKEQANKQIILKNDSETKVSEYGDSEINKCLELIKSYNGWIIDCPIKKSRRYWKLLIQKLNKLDSIKEWKFTRYETLDILLKIISENKFYSWKISSPELIYENLALLMNVCKKDVKKASSSSIVLEAI